MKNEILRRNTLKALQAECAKLGELTNKLERDLAPTNSRKAA